MRLKVRNFRLHINQSINQSIFIYIRQPEPIVARPIRIKIKKVHTTLYNITTQTDEKSRYWSETSADEVHTYIFSAISSNRGRANSLNIMVTL